MCTLFEWWTFCTRNSIKKAKSSARAESRVSCIFKKLENKVSTVDRLFCGEGEERARGLLSLKYIGVRALDLCFRDLAILAVSSSSSSSLPGNLDPWQDAEASGEIHCLNNCEREIFRSVSGKKVDLDLRAFDKLKGDDAECKSHCFSKILPYAFALYSIYSMLFDDNPQGDIAGKHARLLSSCKFQLQTYTLYHEDI